MRLCSTIFVCFFFSADEYAVDEELVKPVNIGFPSLQPTRAEKIAIQSQHLKKQKADPNLEKLSRQKQCKFNDGPMMERVDLEVTNFFRDLYSGSKHR